MNKKFKNRTGMLERTISTLPQTYITISLRVDSYNGTHHKRAEFIQNLCIGILYHLQGYLDCFKKNRAFKKVQIQVEPFIYPTKKK